jgi:hypothetical protein
MPTSTLGNGLVLVIVTAFALAAITATANVSIFSFMDFLPPTLFLTFRNLHIAFKRFALFHQLGFYTPEQKLLTFSC